MAAREFHCTITNQGESPIEWVKDHLDHGDWGDRLPSQETRSVQPGEIAGYDAESGGDIPIIGNFATGTEGWVLYQTRTGAGGIEYILIEHNVPYFQVHYAQARAVVRVYKYDPTQEIGGGEFDDRDKDPPETRILPEFEGGAGPDQGPAFWQEFPYVAAFFVPALVGVPFSYRPVLNIRFRVAGNAAPPDMKFPDIQPEAFDPTFSSVRNSSPQFWAGSWEGQRMQVWITAQDDGMLAVVLQDKESGETHEQTVSIDRLLVSRMKQDFQPIKDLQDRIAEVAVRTERFSMGGRETVKTLGDIEKDAVKLHPDILALEFEEGVEQKPLGGDFLTFSNGSCLELFRMKQNGAGLGFALRFMSKTKGGVPVAEPGAHQEHLFVMASIK